MIIWITGMAGSGKSTISSKVFELIKPMFPATVRLDGDIVREIFNHVIDSDNYSVEGRKINSDRICSLCQMLDNQKINVICSILSIFEEARITNRKNFKNYFEVHLACNYQVLKQRRKFYSLAESGELKNFVGVDLPYPEQNTYDIEFNTDHESHTIESIASAIIEPTFHNFY